MNIKNILKNGIKNIFKLFEGTPKWSERLTENERNHLRKEFGSPRVTITGVSGTMSHARDFIWESGTVVDMEFFTGQYNMYTNKMCYIVQLDNNNGRHLFLREELSHEQLKPKSPIPENCEYFTKPEIQEERVIVQLHEILDYTTFEDDLIKVNNMYAKNLGYWGEKFASDYPIQTLEIGDSGYTRDGATSYAPKNTMYIEGKPSWGSWSYTHCEGSIQKNMDISDCDNQLDILKKALPIIHEYMFGDEYPLSDKAEQALNNAILQFNYNQAVTSENENKFIPPQNNPV